MTTAPVEIGTSAEQAESREQTTFPVDTSATARGLSKERTTRLTRRWRGVVAVALFGAAIGLLAKRPSLVLLGPIGVVFAAYPRLTPAPRPSLSLDRTISSTGPALGEIVEVEVSVRNNGSQTLPDVRIVDGVPPALAVEHGSPRHTAVLRPGQETTFSYRLSATLGYHQFDPATVVVRDLSGGTEVELGIETETEIECTSPGSADTPLRQTQPQVGPVETDVGGSGIEFFGTREYRRGDRLNRIDWRRYARSGELTTIEYREEQIASVVICVDVREPTYRSASDEEPHAVAFGIGAAIELFESVLATPNRVGLATIGHDVSWLNPGGTREQSQRARQLLATVPGRRPSDWESDSTACFTELRRRLPPNAQVVLVSPLPDGKTTEAAFTLEAAGHAVVVVSPDVSNRETVGARLATVERSLRISKLREAGIPVVDWHPDSPLGTELLDAEERWSG